MIQIFLINIIRGVRERPAFPIIPYLTRLKYLVANILEVERRVGVICPNVVHPTYRNKNIHMTSIDESFQISPCIVSFFILFKVMVHPRLDSKGIVAFILAVQKYEWPIIF